MRPEVLLGRLVRDRAITPSVARVWAAVQVFPGPRVPIPVRCRSSSGAVPVAPVGDLVVRAARVVPAARVARGGGQVLPPVVRGVPVVVSVGVVRVVREALAAPVARVVPGVRVVRVVPVVP